jgi:hypothetical protein
MPGLTISETTPMASEQDLATARERIVQLERNENERTKAAAIAGELAKYPLKTGSLEQLSQLIAPSVTITKLTDGRDLILANNRNLDSHVADLLAQPTYGHYLHPKGPTAQGSQPAATAVDGRREILPGENLGAAVARIAQAELASPPGDARLDPKLPFAIGRAALRKP